MRNFTFIFMVTGLLVLAALSSCKLLQEAGNVLADPQKETINLVLPPWPQDLPELAGWKLELNGCQTSRVLGENELKIKVPKNQPLCIIAQPLVKSGAKVQSSFFKCAGALYPYELFPEAQSLSLSWTSGYAATLMKSIINSGRQASYSSDFTEQIISQFNWERLTESLQQAEINPWFLDTPQLLEGIAYHNFSVNKLKVTGSLQVEVDFPLYSSYVPQNQSLKNAMKEGQYLLTIKKDQPNLFALADGNFSTGLLIYGTSIKNISLEFISLPIYISEEL